MVCKGGHKVVVLPGGENDLMPVALKRHPTPVPGMTLEQTYGSGSPEAIKAAKAAGAIVLVNHTENKHWINP